MARLTGSLGSIDLPSLIKFLSDVRKTGTLELRQNGWSAQLGLRDGDLVAASFGGERGISAIYALSLVMKESTFEYIDGPVPAEDELDLTLEQLNDQLRPSRARPLLPFDAVPMLNALNESLAIDDDAPVVLKRTALRNLLAIDGRRTVREIIGDAPLAATLRSLADLLDSGLITVVHAEPGQSNGAAFDQLLKQVQPLTALPLPPRSNGWHANGHSGFDRTIAPTTFEPVPNDAETPLVACPKLGFADDPASHFARPTGLHRCFASGSMKPLSTLEQRDVCLASTYASCPRFRAARAATSDGRTASAGTEPIDAHARDDGATPKPTGSPRDAAPQPASRPTGGVAVLPILAVSLTVVAVLAWAYLLLARPSQNQPHSQVQSTPLVVVNPVQARPDEAGQPATAEATTLPTSTAAPTAAPTQTAPPPTSSAQRLETSFSDATDGWLLNRPWVTRSPGAYRLNSRTPGQFVAVAAPLQAAVGDVEVSATMRKLGGPPGGGYGLVVRDQEPRAHDGPNQLGHYYVVEVGDQGDVGMWRRDSDRWSDLRVWTHSDLVHTGLASNELVVQAVGNQLKLMVNGTEVITQTDATYREGGVGVFVGGDDNDVAVERFAAKPIAP